MMDAAPRKTVGLVPLPEEMIVHMSVNGHSIAKMSCSPYRLKEFAFGWIFSQGFIESLSDIASYKIEDSCPKIRIWLKEQVLDKLADFAPVQSSACAGGAFSSALLKKLIPLSREYGLELSTLKLLMKELYKREELYQLYGGVHCSMLVESKTEQVVVSMEDIGRSNSMDKLIGWGLERNIDFSSLLLFVTGRISSDMILKAYRAKIATIVSLTTATTLAYEISQKTNQTLVCHVLKPRPILINF